MCRHDLAVRWLDDEPVDLVVDALPLLRLGLIIVGVRLVVESAVSFASVLVNAGQNAVRASLASADELSLRFDNPVIALTSLPVPLAKAIEVMLARDLAFATGSAFIG